jgi:putative transposase
LLQRTAAKYLSTCSCGRLTAFSPTTARQYTSIEFTNRLTDWRLARSDDSVGNCYDNAAMEAFWARLKKEVRYLGPIERFTRSQLRTILFDNIEVFYNRSRHQRAFGDGTPVEGSFA